MTKDEALAWLAAKPGNAIKINYFCVKTKEQLESGTKMWMEVVPEMRGATYLEELAERPHRCKLINIDEKRNTRDLDVVVCPWCGHKHDDGWDRSEGPQNCNFCDQPFDLEKEMTVTYTTRRT